MVQPRESIENAAPPQVEALDAELQFQAFDALLVEKGTHPRRSDRYMGPCYTALHDAIHEVPELEEIYREVLSAKYPNHHVLGQVSAKALVRPALEAHNEGLPGPLPNFPGDLITKIRPNRYAKARATANWRTLIDWVVSDPDRFSTFAGDIKNRTVQTNKFQRYVAIEAALHIFRSYGRLPNSPSILDVGCAQNHGNKVLASTLPFYDVKRSSQATPKGTAMALFINDNLGLERIEKGRLDGVDIVPIDDDSSEWSLYNSFYLTELDEKPKLVKDYEAVDNLDPPNVNFIQADFAAPDLKTDPPDGLKPDGYDVASIVTVLHQLSPQQQKNMFVNTLAQLKPDGLMIIQDFFERVEDPNSPTGYSYVAVQDWDNRKGLYLTLVFDKAAPEKGFQPLFKWKNARCEELEDCNYDFEIALSATLDS